MPVRKVAFDWPVCDGFPPYQVDVLYGRKLFTTLHVDTFASCGGDGTKAKPFRTFGQACALVDSTPHMQARVQFGGVVPISLLNHDGDDLTAIAWERT